LHRRRHAARSAEEADLLVADAPAQRLVGDVVGGAGDVPGIEDVHAQLSFSVTDARLGRLPPVARGGARTRRSSPDDPVPAPDGAEEIPPAGPRAPIRQWSAGSI